MALNLDVVDVPTDSPGTDTGYGKEPVGQTREECKEKAQEQGGLTYDEHAMACWPIYGEVIPIGDTIASIQEGFQITNKNFGVSGDQPPVPTQDDLPGDFSVETKSITA